MWRRMIAGIMIVLVAAVLAGCAVATTAQSESTGASDLGKVEQLLLGSLMLESTEQAVSAEQAPELLVLWKAYRALSASDSTAQAELVAVASQIDATMTAEQLAAIAAMNLTRSDLSVYIQEKGLMSGATSATSQSGSQSVSAPAGGPGGEMGGPPAGEMMGGMEGVAPTGAEGDAQVSGVVSRVPTALYDTFITLLTTRA